MRCSGTNRFEYGKSFLPTLFRSKTPSPFPIGAICINTIIERFITTSDDLVIVSEKRKGLLYHLLLAALTFPKWK